MDSSKIYSRLDSIEARLDRLEAGHKPPAPAEAAPARNPWTSKPVVQQQRRAGAFSEVMPGNWLGIIAIVCFVLAGGFIVKLSIESGWLTPTRQIGLAALLGAGLIVVGLALLKTDRAFAGLLPGAGIVVLYLAGFAAHRYYALISFEAAIVLTGAVSAICLWLYAQIRHDAYALTAAVGAYIAPSLLGMNTGAVFSLYYFLVCSTVFAVISIMVQSRTLTLVSSYLAIFMSGVVGMDLREDMLTASLLAVHFLIFALGTYAYTIWNRRPLDKSEAGSFSPVLLLFYAIEYYFIDRFYPGLAPWVSLGFAALLIGLYGAARRYFPEGLNSQSLILAFAAIVCFHSVYLELLPADFRPWLFALIMFAVAFSPLDPGAPKREGFFQIPALAILAILAIEYASMVSQLLHGYDGAWLAASFAAFASLWCVLAFARHKLAAQPAHGGIVLAAAHVLAVAGLYRLTEEAGSLAVSAAWLFYAVAVLVFSFARKDAVMAKSALFVLGFAAGKALLYDAASAPTVVRIFCLLLTGAVLYGCGLFMRKADSWNEAPKRLQAS